MIEWKAKWKIFLIIFISVLLVSFILQKKKELIVNNPKVELSVNFNEESPKNIEIIKSLNRIGFLCMLAGLHDCERNLIPQRALYDGFLPRPPSGNEKLDFYLQGFAVKTTSPLNVFSFEFTADFKDIKSEAFYVDLINRNIESRFIEEIARRKRSFSRESELKIDAIKLISEKKNQLKAINSIQKATLKINDEFENVFRILKKKNQEDFLTMKSMTVVSPPVVNDDTGLTGRIFRSVFIGLFITVYLLAFYVYYRKKG